MFFSAYCSAMDESLPILRHYESKIMTIVRQPFAELITRKIIKVFLLNRIASYELFEGGDICISNAIFNTLRNFASRMWTST